MPKGIYIRTQKSLHWQYKSGPEHPRWNGGKIGARYKRYRLLNQLKNKPCADCLGWYEPCQMDFDHRGDKLFQISHAKQKSLQRVLEEVAKCDLVCSNCHRLRTQKRLNVRHLKAVN